MLPSLQKNVAHRAHAWTLFWTAALVMVLAGSGVWGIPVAARVHAQDDPAGSMAYLPLVAAYRPPRYCQPVAVQEEIEAEVLGGRETAVDAWRCVAAIVYRGEPTVYYGQYCGGTLIAPRWVLTAAHCVSDYPPGEVDVVLGRHRLVQTGGEQIHAQRFVIHPDFNRNTNHHDIALILLERASRYAPAQMIDQDDTQLSAASKRATVVGWGRAEFGYPYELREADVPIVSNNVCNERWLGLVTAQMLCAGEITPSYTGACFGDSGGPLFVRNMSGDGWEQIGIVSWGSAHCRGNYGVYTRLSKYNDWVRSAICRYTPDEPLCRGDAYEEDNTPAAAKPITADGAHQERYFHVEGDVDWVRLEAEAGLRYRIQTAYLGYRSDTVLDLYAADGKTRIARNDNYGEGLASSLTWTATETETYFVRVRHKGSAHGLNTRYYLSLRTVP